MTHRQSEITGPLDWAAATETHPHEVSCGDAYLVKQTRVGALACVIDGLGHGSEARLAAEVAIASISEYAERSLEEIFSLCHEQMRTTRGAVLSLVMFEPMNKRLTWCGVGNIDSVILRDDGSREWLPLRGGIVGCRLPNVRASTIAIESGDLLVMYSDGIGSQCIDSISQHDSPPEVADKIMRNHLKGTDDALVLVARYSSTA